jgi:DNA-binding NtrC family response regulator
MPLKKQIAKLLLVDDEAVVRFTASTVLVAQNFKVRTVATVAEALALIHTEKFELLVSDLNIAVRHDGLTVIEAMHRKQPKCLTFILTATPDLESLLWAIRNKVDDYFMKISDEQALGVKLRAHLAAATSDKRPTIPEHLQHEVINPDQQTRRARELHLVLPKRSAHHR